MAEHEMTCDMSADVLDGWDIFFSLLNKALMEYEALDSVSALQESKLHHICAQIEHLLSGLHSITQFVHNMIDFPHLDVEDILYIQRIKEDLLLLTVTISQEIVPDLHSKLDGINDISFNSRLTNERMLDMDQVCHLRSLGIKWGEIADLFGVSRMTLYRKRSEAGILDNFTFSSISCEELQGILENIRQNLPYSGERILMGYLRSMGISVQRWKLRQALHAMEPICTTLRWRPRIQRRPYNVPGPMSLWHLGEYQCDYCT